MKKLLFALANVFLVNMSVIHRTCKIRAPGFDVLRDSIAYVNIDTLATRVR